jgi:chromosome segregation ATPase
MDRMGDFSLLPSLIVLGVVLLGLGAVSTVLRRRSARGRATSRGSAPAVGGAPVRIPVDELLTRANIQLVQMDDSIRDAADELEFARAEFGDPAVRDFEDALATARQRASEAFAIKQRLDDTVPDTEQEQRDWSKRILSLTDSVSALVATHTGAIAERRRAELAAPGTLARLNERIAAVQDRIPLAAATLAELADAYDPDAFADVTGNVQRAAAALDEARAGSTDAATALESAAVAPVARQVQQAEAAVREAQALLDAIDRSRDALREARLARTRALDSAGARLAEAESLRLELDDADAAQAILDAEKRMRDAVDAAARRRPAHPSADVDALATAATALDQALASARTSQQRLDSAREALVGALEIAESHLRTASDLISSRRSGVGTDARTRLAAAERELHLARAESDPVAALDGARRAATLATDADALARYDTLHTRTR